jgi:hypothetical protein
MQKWLSVAVLTLAVMVAAMGMQNLTVRASGNTQPLLAAWGGAPLPPTHGLWGGAPLPPTHGLWGGAPLPPTHGLWGGAPLPPTHGER